MLKLTVTKVIDSATEKDPRLKTIAKLADQCKGAGFLEEIRGSRKPDGDYVIEILTRFSREGYTFDGPTSLNDSYKFLQALFFAWRFNRPTADAAAMPDEAAGGMEPMFDPDEVVPAPQFRNVRDIRLAETL